MTQTSMIPLIKGTSLAIFAGTKKIPEPITEPTTTQRAANGPSTRGSSIILRSGSLVGAIAMLPDLAFRPVGDQRSDSAHTEHRLGVFAGRLHTLSRPIDPFDRG